MSKVLMIRHLPVTLSFQEKEKLLKHFGAENIWENSRKRNYVFASFSSIEQAKASLLRLHQLEIAHRRLVVEYSLEKEPITQTEQSAKSSATTENIQEFLKILNAWSPSVDFYQPPPIHLKYKYPPVTPNIVIEVISNLFTVKPFYIQTLHLMNRMCLDSPFTESKRAINFFKETFRHFFLEEQQIPKPVSEPESEISSDEAEKRTQPAPTFKRKRKLPAPIKTAAAVLSTASSATLPKVKKVPFSQKEVFEPVNPILEPKKISVVVHHDALHKQTEEPDIIGELGKYEKEAPPEVVKETTKELEPPTITKKELLRNRISYSDMRVLPIFKNYHPGQPSMRLYVKNLAKTVTEQDVKRIYRRYIEILADDEQIGFDVRVMQEGRMKGQAFVTFPSVSTAEKALHETNGFLLKERPMVVQFARAANKKSID